MVRRKVNRKEVHIMTETTLKLSIRDIITAEAFFHFWWDLKGPPNEWYQVWIRTAAEDEEFGFREDWKVNKEDHFDGGGNARNIVMLVRGTHVGHRVQLMAIGENNVFSNLVETPPLTPPPDAPEEAPTLKYQCYYCKKRFETTGELKEHQITCPEYIKATQGTADSVDKVAESMAYDAYARSAVEYTGIPEELVRGALREREAIETKIAKDIAGKTPKEIYEGYDLENVAANLAYFGQVTLAMTMEAAPWIDIGMASLSYLGVPASCMYSGYVFSSNSLRQYSCAICAKFGYS